MVSKIAPILAGKPDTNDVEFRTAAQTSAVLSGMTAPVKDEIGNIVDPRRQYLRQQTTDRRDGIKGERYSSGRKREKSMAQRTLDAMKQSSVVDLARSAETKRAIDYSMPSLMIRPSSGLRVGWDLISAVWLFYIAIIL